MANPAHDIKKLSASTSGQPVLITSTGPTDTLGTQIHQVPDGKRDRIELWAWSNSTAVVQLTLQLGTTATAREITVDIPPKGALPTLVVPYLLLESGQVVSAFASVGSTICVAGHVNERTPAA